MRFSQLQKRSLSLLPPVVLSVGTLARGYGPHGGVHRGTRRSAGTETEETEEATPESVHLTIWKGIFWFI